MKLKFTPLVLFLILLVVLVISVVFGYKTKIYEGAGTKNTLITDKINDGKTKVYINKGSGELTIDSDEVDGIIVVSSEGDESVEKEPFALREGFKEGAVSKSKSSDAHAFVYSDDYVIIPYINLTVITNICCEVKTDF
jgi:hypothetical protein